MSPTQLPLLPLVLDDVPPGLRQALAQEGVPACRRSSGGVEGRLVLFDSRKGLSRPPGYGQIAIDVDPLRERCETDPMEALLVERSARHQWQVAGLSICEEISVVDRRAERRRMLDALRELVEQAGGVWLCAAAYPFPYRSALNFRFDHDRHEPRDFDAVLDAISGNEHATSHFVGGAAYQPHPDALGRLAGLDVGSHGYRHHTYPTRDENLQNIRRGIETLQAAGLEPSGFAAPHGRFHRELLAAMEQLGIGHSSEFGLAYDDLPFFPEGSRVLQIPVHPVCLGIFLEAAQGEGPRRAAALQQAVHAAVDYFRQTARAKYRAGEPVFLYGHPDGRLGRYPQVLRAAFDTADQFGAIWKTTLSEFAAWWRLRSGVRLSVEQRGDAYEVKAAGLPPGYRMAVEYWRGRHVARMPLDGLVLRFAPSALAYENRAAQGLVRPVRVDRPEGLRGHLRRWIDWERETPVEEIGAGSWRHIVKRTLRRWKG